MATEDKENGISRVFRHRKTPTRNVGSTKYGSTATQRNHRAKFKKGAPARSIIHR